MTDQSVPVEVFEGAIGIDLGTTYSCVAVFLHNRLDIIPNDQGNRTTPSCVAYGGNQGILVGDAAKALLTKTPEQVLYDAKRLIGRQFDDVEVQQDLKIWPFKVVTEESDSTVPLFEVNHQGETRRFKPEQVSATVLSYLRRCAEKHLGKQVTKAVITVPAYFNDAQRERTKAAGVIAGLDVLRIINEPTAAALAYGIDGHAGADAGGDLRSVLVFDFGGGTFDVSVVSIEDSIFAVRSTAGDTHLGGQDIDAALCHYVVEDIRRKHKTDLTQSPKPLAKIRRTCETAKKALSHATQYTIDLEGVLPDGEDYSLTITRAKLEELCSKIFKQCLTTVGKAVADAGMTPADIHEVVMVGGSSRIPKVNTLVSEFFGGKSLNNRVSPDEAIALGAAIQASILSNCPEQQSEATENVLLMDVLPLSLGLDMDDGKFEVIIPRNAQIPHKKTKEVSTYKKNQTEVQVEVYEGERPLVKDNRRLGEFSMKGIKKAPAGIPSIMVTYAIDADGCLTVTAEENITTGGSSKSRGAKSSSLVVHNEDRLSADEIEKMLADAKEMAAKDATSIKIFNLIQPVQAALEEQIADFEELYSPEGGVDTQPPPGKVLKLKNVAKSAVEWLVGEGKQQTSTAFLTLRAEKMMGVAAKLRKKIRKLRKKLGKSTGCGEEEDASSEDDEDDDEGGAGEDTESPAKKKARTEV